MTSILWLRRDLRLQDQPALNAAAADGPVLPVFIVDPALITSAGKPRLSALGQALTAVNEAFDGALVMRTGSPAEVLPALAREVGASAVHISAESEPYGAARDRQVRDALIDGGVQLVATGSPYAVTPGRVLTRTGTPYRVFTPFARAWREHGWRAPATVPAGLRWARGVASEPRPASFGNAEPTPALPVGEAAALARWREFLDSGLDGYALNRDQPAVDGTSRLSVALKFGTVHPRTLLADLAARPSISRADVMSFVNEVAWREFYADVLLHTPASAKDDWRPDFTMDYDDPADPTVGARLEAWRTGRTGYPLVDAGMRQLAATGWMHNRVRMVAASFLVKDLHLWWRHGQTHFDDLLADADVASNAHGWQWVAGTGTDAAPYFRIMNPVSQAKRYDPDAQYIRRWIPELAHLSSRAHEPWLAADGYSNGYPARIVDHAVERLVALERYGATRH